jgi:hypothetical protein
MSGVLLAAILAAAPPAEAEPAPKAVEDTAPEPASVEEPEDTKTTAEPTPTPAPTTPATTSPPPAAQQPLPATTPPPPPPRRDRLRRDIPLALFRVDVLVGGGTQRIADRSYLAFDDGPNIPGPTVLVRADARLGGSDVFLGGGVGYRRMWTNTEVFGETDTRLVVQDLMIFGRLSWSPIEGLDPFVEVGTGPSFVDLHVRSGFRSHQREVLVLFDSLAGVALSLPRKWHPSNHVTAGVELGLGYTLRSELDVRAQPVDEDGMISTTGARLGDVRLHGLLWRAGLFLRFM